MLLSAEPVARTMWGFVHCYSYLIHHGLSFLPALIDVAVSRGHIIDALVQPSPVSSHCFADLDLAGVHPQPCHQRVGKALSR